MNPKKFTITSGIKGTEYEGCLFAIRAIRETGKHSMYLIKPNLDVSIFSLNQQYNLGESMLVQASPLLAQFCAYLRQKEGADKLYIYRRASPPENFDRIILEEKRHWIGVDFDGVLAMYDRFQGIEFTGEPILPMVRRVQQWLNEGEDVRVFTARVSVREGSRSHIEASRARTVISNWCLKHIGLRLPVTNVKDFGMKELWDDKCVAVEKNTGNYLTYRHVEEV